MLEPGYRREVGLDRRKRGVLGEEIAVAFLSLRGYQIEARNYRHGHREIDIVARRGKAFVFVEVKYRESSSFGGAARATGFSKQSDVLRAAVGFLKERGEVHPLLRFDVVAIEMQENGRVLRAEQIENAFEGGDIFTL